MCLLRCPVFVALLICGCLSVTSGYFSEKKKPVYLDGLVGSFVVFNCKITFPLDTPVPYSLHWYKDVSILGGLSKEQLIQSMRNST